jgi:hypothetical protein
MNRIAISCFALCVCVSQANADFITEWNEELRATIRATSTPPPRASRAMAMVHLAVYDAVNATNRTHQPFRYTTVVPNASAEAAAAQAARDVLVSLYPARQSTYDTLLSQQLSTIANGSAKSSGISLGSAVASDMIGWRSSDGSNASSTYASVNEPGRWRPTPNAFAQPLLPQWASVTPFAIPSAASFRAVAPPALNSVEYANAVNEVKALGSATSSIRTADQTEIAQFWANGAGTETPPGHWNRIALLVGQQQGNSPADNARMLAQLNVSLADAAISSWDTKYHYDLWRPITAIRDAEFDENSLTVDDDSWTPLLVTPPFPEYTSGHSTFSGAGAAALADFFGTDAIPFTVGSDDLANVLRSYNGFHEASIESGLSRIYGGIHFSFGNTAGESAGTNIGNYVSANYFAAIPEPSSIALLGLGTCLLAALKLRSRRVVTN